MLHRVSIILIAAIGFLCTEIAIGLGTEFDNLNGWGVSAGEASVRKGTVTIKRGKVKRYGEIRSHFTLDVDQYPIMEINCLRGEFMAYLADTYQQDGDIDYISLGKKRGKGYTRFHLKDLTSWTGRRNAVLVIQTRKTLKLDYVRFIPAGESQGVPYYIPDISKYIIRRAIDTITVDGKFNELSWKYCQPMQPLMLFDGHLKTLSSTTARIVWDEKNLYLAVECKDPDIFGTRTEYDDNLWVEDVLELFVTVPNSPKYFVEFEISPRGTMMDILNLRNYFGSTNWTCKNWKAKVVLDGTIDNRDDVDKGWNVEMVIPLFDFYIRPYTYARATIKEKEYENRKEKHPGDAPYGFDFRPKSGDTWRLNIYRIDYMKTHAEYQAWSPTLIQGFHVPKRFGEVTFSTEVVRP